MTERRSNGWVAARTAQRVLLVLGTLILLTGSAFAADIPFAAKVNIGSNSSAHDAIAADIDGDGDLDVVTAAGTRLAWFENTGGGAFSSTVNALITQSAGQLAWSLAAEDLDADGDVDVLAGFSWPSGYVGWDVLFENLNDGQNWNAVALGGGSDQDAAGVSFGDLDLDGDIDIVAFLQASKWIENQRGSWVDRPLDGLMWSGSPADMDNDGDLDIVGISSLVALWLRNDRTTSIDWPAVSVPSQYTYASFAADLDQDGDIDVVSGGETAVGWAENTGGSFTYHVIWSTVDNAYSVFSADLDADGDMDVLSANDGENTLTWFENNGSQIFSKHQMATGFDGRAVSAADLDGDGDLDVLATASGYVGWYRNLTIHRSASYLRDTVVGSSVTRTSAVALADIDTDGDLDVVSAAAGSDAVAWHENSGGAFVATSVIAGPASGQDEPRDVVVSDLDQDGDLDVVVASTADGGVRWYANDGGGASFSSQAPVTTGATGVLEIDVADLNWDGNPDVLVAATGADTVIWYAGDGAGSFNEQTALSTVAYGVSSVYAVDLDGDARMDVVAALTDSNTVAWWAGDGAGGFAARSNVTATAVGVVSVRSGDLDADGDMDVVAASSDNSVAWYENNGSEQFTRWVIATGADGATSLLVRDLNGDGALDVAGSSASGSTVTWYMNDGATPPSFSIAPSSSQAACAGIAAGDVDRDGNVDLVAAVGGADEVRLYANGGGQFALLTTDTAPVEIPEGETDDVLVITAHHRGVSGDRDVEIATLGLQLEASDGVPLNSTEANNLIANLVIYRDGPGTVEGEWDASDPLVITVPTLSLVYGVQTVTFVDNDTDVQLVVGTPKTFFVVLQMTANAESQSPNTVQVTHMTESSSTGEDRTNDQPVTLEWAANVTSTLVTARPRGAEMSIALSDAADPVEATDTITYTVMVNNAGTLTADNVVVTATLPVGTSFQSATGTGWSCGEAAGIVTCTLASLVEGDADPISIAVTAPDEGGPISCSATVSADQTDYTAGNDSASEQTTITPVSDLAVTMVDSPDPVPFDATLAYTVGVTNSGPSTASSVSMVQGLPAGAAFGSATGGGFSCGEAGGTVTCGLASLAAGSSATVTVTVTAPAVEGQIASTATVSSASIDPAGGNDSAQALTDVVVSQRAALEAIYASTNGASWTDNTNWLSGDICTWYGVVCSLGDVTYLALVGNNLDGPLPAEIKGLTHLQGMYLSDNAISGAIPAELGELTELTEIWLQVNQLSGSLPSSLGNLTSLTFVDLHENQLSGPIPPSLGGLASLESLLLHRNQLSGSIPTTFSGLSSLVTLDLSSNQLSGSIPAAIGGLTTLETLLLSENLLSGALPSALSSLSGLQNLGLASNGFSGEVPDLTALTALGVGRLDLRWNGLTVGSPAQLAFLDARQVGGDVLGTQTVPPDDLHLIPRDHKSMLVEWTPIAYTANEGGTRVYLSTAGSGGPYVLQGETIDKTVSDFTICCGLAYGPRYYVRLESFTSPHANNPGEVVSEPSTPSDSRTVLSTATGYLRMSHAAYLGAEGEDKAILVRRLGGSSGVLTVDVDTSAGSAQAGVDYTTVSTTLTWPAGDVEPQTVSVELLEDAGFDDGESLNLTLTGASLGTPSSSVLTIEENDLVGDAEALANSTGYRPTVASAAAGPRIVVWQEDDRDGQSAGIYSMVYDSTGGPVAGQLQTNTAAIATKTRPATAAGDDDFVVVWNNDSTLKSNGTFGKLSGPGVVAQRVGTNGAVIGGEVALSSDSYDSVTAVAVGRQPVSGDYVAAWQAAPTGHDDGIFVRFFAADGTALTATLTVDDGASGAVSEPSVAVNEGGDTVVTWSRVASDGFTDVYHRRYHFAVGPSAAAALVNVDTWGDQGAPSVVVADDGSYVVAWQGPSLPDVQGARVAGTDVFARQYGSSGTPAGQPFRVNALEADAQTAPRVILDGTDCWAAWLDEGASGVVEAIGRLLPGCGVSSEAEVALNDVSGSASVRSLDVTIAADGVLTSVYVKDDADEGDGSVVGRALQTEPPLFADGFESGGTSAWSERSP